MYVQHSPFYVRLTSTMQASLAPMQGYLVTATQRIYLVTATQRIYLVTATPKMYLVTATQRID